MVNSNLCIFSISSRPTSFFSSHKLQKCANLAQVGIWYRYVDLGEIKKAANFLVLVKLKVMDDNVCKLHIGPRAEAARSLTHFFLLLLPLTKDELAFIIGSS